MQDQQYMFKDFDLFPDKHEGALFYSPEISAHLENKNLISLLQEIKNNKINYTKDSTLNGLIEKFNLQNTTVKKYLSQELRILAMLEDDRFGSLFLNTDDISIQNTLHEYFAGRFGVKLFSQLDETVLNDKSLIFMFNSIYWPDDFDKAYRLAQKYQAWVITAYVANHYLVIDNIYNPQKGMPCHFCNFNRHQNLVMSKNTLKTTAWTNYARRALLEGIESLPAMRFTAVEKGLMTFWLAKQIRNFINPHAVSLSLQEVSCYTWINLISGEMNQEQAVHWLDCPCRSRDN